MGRKLPTGSKKIHQKAQIEKNSRDGVPYVPPSPAFSSSAVVQIYHPRRGGGGSEGVSLDTLVGSEVVPCPLKSFEGSCTPRSRASLRGCMNGIFQVNITKIAKFFFFRACGAREQVAKISWYGMCQKVCIHEPAQLA